MGSAGADESRGGLRARAAGRSGSRSASGGARPGGARAGAGGAAPGALRDPPAEGKGKGGALPLHRQG